MNTFRYYLLIGIISFLPFLPIFATPLLPHTSDGGVHLPRMAAYYKALRDGHIPVRWAGDLNYGYGLPLFNFMYHVPYLISSIFIFFGFGLVITFKLVLFISFLVSGISMFAFTNEFFGDMKKAFFVTIFYQFAPFRLVELFVRGAIGGIYAYSFLPVVLWGIIKLTKKPSPSTFAFTGIATGLLILSHNSLSLIFLGVCGAFILLWIKRGKSILVALGALLYGLAIGAFYWIPALGEHKYTYGDLFMKDLFRTHFPPFINFFIPNLTNSQALRTAEISVQLGIFHSLALLLAFWVLIKNKNADTHTKIFLRLGILLTLASFFFMQPVSLFLWERISFLRQFQFPWRFLGLTSFATALLSAAYLSQPILKKRNIFALILIFTIITTWTYWHPPEGFDRVNESEFWNYPLNTTYFGETDVIWSAGPAKSYPKTRIEVIDGRAAISDFTKKTQIHTFSVDAETDTRLVDNTQYFPGWKVYDNMTKIPIQFQDQNWRGLITFMLPKGHHIVRVVFEESKLRLFADLISLGAIVGLLFLFGKNFLRQRPL